MLRVDAVVEVIRSVLIKFIRVHRRVIFPLDAERTSVRFIVVFQFIRTRARAELPLARSRGAMGIVDDGDASGERASGARRDTDAGAVPDHVQRRDREVARGDRGRSARGRRVADAGRPRGARGVVDTPTPGKGFCGRATRVDGQHDHVCWFCAHWYHGRRLCAPELCLCALKIVTVQRQTVTCPPFATSAIP